MPLPSIEQVLTDPAASFWLKSALHANLKRDPVDALNDAELLQSLLRQRLDQLMGATCPSR